MNSHKEMFGHPIHAHSGSSEAGPQALVMTKIAGDPEPAATSAGSKGHGTSEPPARKPKHFGKENKKTGCACGSMILTHE